MVELYHSCCVSTPPRHHWSSEKSNSTYQQTPTWTWKWTQPEDASIARERALAHLIMQWSSSFWAVETISQKRGDFCNQTRSDFSIIFGYFGQIWYSVLFGAQNIKNEPHRHNPAQLPSQSFSDSVTNDAAYGLACILPLGFRNHYPPHLRHVELASSPPRPLFTLIANS